MEVKFDIVKPNLYVHKNHVYFGVDSSDVIPIARSVDEIVRKHIGELKVTEADLETVKSGRSKEIEKRYVVPLNKYLDALERKVPRIGVTNDDASLFGLDYLVIAGTVEDLKDMGTWRALQRDLADPEKTFDISDKHIVYRIDRGKTLQEMKKLNEELTPKIPDNCAGLTVVRGCVLSGKQTNEIKYLGAVGFLQLKAKDRTKIEEAKSQLVERLKQVDGPCLSLDVPFIHEQIWRLYDDALELIRKYGDVLTDPNWQRRLFRLDP